MVFWCNAEMAQWRQKSWNLDVQSRLFWEFLGYLHYVQIERQTRNSTLKLTLPVILPHINFYCGKKLGFFGHDYEILIQDNWMMTRVTHT